MIDYGLKRIGFKKSCFSEVSFLEKASGLPHKINRKKNFEKGKEVGLDCILKGKIELKKARPGQHYFILTLYFGIKAFSEVQ